LFLGSSQHRFHLAVCGQHHRRIARKSEWLLLDFCSVWPHLQHQASQTTPNQLAQNKSTVTRTILDPKYSSPEATKPQQGALSKQPKLELSNAAPGWKLKHLIHFSVFLITNI
jgi:hypothetical protein